MTRRIRFTLVHVLVGLIIAGLSAGIMLFLWYPAPYTQLAGGAALLLMLIGIDAILGPVLTALISKPSKSRSELLRDVGVIGLLQTMALGYGLHIVIQARPVHLVFEVDRFRVVTASDVKAGDLSKAAPAYQQLPWTGPTVIAARKSTNQQEMLHALELGLQGVDISMQPERWVDYNSQTSAVIAASKTVNHLRSRYPHIAVQIDEVAARYSTNLDGLRYLPVISRQRSWTALIATSDARVLGFLPVDAFF